MPDPPVLVPLPPVLLGVKVRSFTAVLAKRTTLVLLRLVLVSVTVSANSAMLPAMPDCTCKALVLVPAKTTGLPNTCCQLKVRLALPPALLVDKAASSTNGPLLATTADCWTLATGKGLLNARAA